MFTFVNNVLSSFRYYLSKYLNIYFTLLLRTHPPPQKKSLKKANVFSRKLLLMDFSTFMVCVQIITSNC